MRILIKTLLVMFAILSVFVNSHAKEQKGYLDRGKKVSAMIIAGQKHIYKVKMEKDQFALIEVMQKGADIQITTYDFKGKKITDFDSPNGTSGPESAELLSSAKGDYIVEVQAMQTDADQRIYELTLNIVRPKAVKAEQRIDEIFAPFDNSKSPGASVAVIRGGKLIFSKGYGMANLEHNIPLTSSTLLQVASVTKSFTCYCILLLAQQGRLKLDDDIHKYIPEVPDFGHLISLRQLMQHTSGIRDYAALRGMARYEIDTKEMFFKTLARQHDLNFIPGADVDYSNTGAVLLAEVIQRLTGQSYAGFVKKNIFDPLGMHSSLVRDDQSMLIPGLAGSYDRSADGPKKLYDLGSLVGGTGVISNARDMALWAAHLMQPKENAKSIVYEMRKPAKLNNGMETTFGAGIMLADHKGHMELGHSGAIAGFKAHLGLYPDDDLSVVVLANTNDIYSRPLARQIAELYFRPSGKTSSAKHLISSASVDIAKTAVKLNFDPKTVDLSKYTGTFFSDEVPTTYWFKVIDGQLVVQPSYLSDMKLSPKSEDIFTGAFDGTTEFVRDSKGGIIGCKFSFHGMRNLYFKKVQ